MKKYIAIDQGTTSSRAIIFDQNFTPLSQSQVEYKLSYPQDGWVEVDPQEILNTVIRTTTSVLDEQNSSIPIACGITNQRETTIVWNKKSGEPIYPAIIWQDRRTKKYCDELKEKGFEGIINKKTGLVLDPYFSATKIKWILDNVEGKPKKEICCLGLLIHFFFIISQKNQIISLMLQTHLEQCYLILRICLGMKSS